MGADSKQTLWKAADKLRAQMDAAEHKHIVLGLIFFKYFSDTFVKQQNKIREMCLILTRNTSSARTLPIMQKSWKSEITARKTTFSVYERIFKPHPHAQPENYILYPQYQNRTTASSMLQRLFMQALRHGGIEVDTPTGKAHSLYSLRHTAICMSIINSEGKVNIFNLAKNTGTSVDQIERFYARFLPLSKAMAKNLQSFGE